MKPNSTLLACATAPVNRKTSRKRQNSPPHWYHLTPAPYKNAMVLFAARGISWHTRAHARAQT
eukprot:6025330-Lingulodinium_polyedra.AAC.1